MRSYMGHARAITGFALVPALSLLSTLFVLPIVSAKFGAPGWIALTIGQSVGALMGVAVALGWPIVGANDVATALPEDRVRLARDSITSRMLTLACCTPVGCVIDLLVIHAHVLSAILFTIATAGNGLTFAWFYAGVRSPGRLLANEALVRLAGNLVAVPLLLVFPSLNAYAMLMLLVAIIMVLLNMRATCRSDEPWVWRRGWSHVRLYWRLTGARVFMGAGSYLSSTIVASVNHPALATFSALDRLQKSAGNATDAVPAGLAGWVSAPAPGTADRARRVRLAFIAAWVEVFVVVVGWALVGRFVSRELFHGAISVGFWQNLLNGLCVGLYAAGAMLAQLVMVPLGKVGIVTRANLVAAPVSIVTLGLGAWTSGVSGALGGATLALLVPVTVFTVAYLRPKAELPRRAEVSL